MSTESHRTIIIGAAKEDIELNARIIDVASKGDVIIHLEGGGYLDWAAELLILKDMITNPNTNRSDLVDQVETLENMSVEKA